MQIQIQSSPQSRRGYALMITLGFTAVSLLLLASLGRRTANGSMLTARNNAYNQSVAAAESATEVVIAQMSRDFLHQALSASASFYSAATPGSLIGGGWSGDYQFSDGQGNTNQTGVACQGWQQWTNLNSEFVGLYGLVTTYDITASAKMITGLYPVAAGVSQNIQLTSIPIFQYAIFYTLDLEINPGPAMVVSGKVHSNGDLYLAPVTSLEFVESVSASGHVYFNRSTNDQQYGASMVTPVFDSTHLEQVSSMNLPVGTDNNPANVVQILDPPPLGEAPSSAMGKERYYNKSDLVIVTTDSSVTVQFNQFEDGSAFSLVPTNAIPGGGNSGYSFVNTNVQFYDYREGKPVLGTEISVAALTNWVAGSGYAINQIVQTATGHGINSVYVDDQRTAAGKLNAVRLTDGQFLPAAGLTVSTPRPLYVKGNFNAPDLTVGSTNTAQTAPASLVSDAINILSPNWNDAWTAGTPLSARGAANATVNAAFLSGIVPSQTVNGSPHYSGGVENFPRFLEDWSASTLTYNGSMVVMFPSRYATSFWIAPGTYYNPPKRDWAFDKNFLSVNKLPPATPQVRKLQRGNWSLVAAGN